MVGRFEDCSRLAGVLALGCAIEVFGVETSGAEGLRSVAAGAAGESALTARLLVMTTVPVGSDEAASVEVVVGHAASRLRPLRPCIVGIQPLSAEW